MSRDLPILFSGSMVRAILREIEQPGTGKTQTRRVLKPLPRRTIFFDQATAGQEQFQEPRYSAGDRLYVREAHYLTDDGDYEQAVFAADTDAVADHLATITRLESSHPTVDWSRHKRLRQSIHMPRWASRITLIVTSVRVQRLQKISREDAMAEGVVQTWGDFMGEPPMWAVASINRHGDASGSHIYDNRTSVENFRELWNHINADRGHGWDANPWVAAYTFQPILGNIDQVAL